MDGSRAIGDPRDRPAFAARWADAVAGTSYVPWERPQLVRFLRGLTDRLLELARADTFDAAATQQIGTELVAAHTSPARSR
jgi:hypothetical protein